ncbi:MAG: nucleotide sugar dehydrogenase [Peptoniphilaceae bacterium]|nr:nucleotide sugar dehydrogenase [Peptoniphilaceae bacterium]MDD7383757.1 nucleotide sugar dehydrogenase [Peptoniphilaceae bacterium]MDY3737844.1 nucleotide sugar dehydrogenase [Peptoniphilaceae bacterium]
MKITVVGLGYVGLSNAILFSLKNEVVGIDLDDEKVKSINERKSPLRDEEIIYYLENKNLNLIAKKNVKDDYKDSGLIVLSLPTNFDEEKDNFDTSILDCVLDDIFSDKKEHLVMIKSTVPIGYTNKVNKKYPYGTIVFSPEFLREGKALYDSLNPSRIIIGEKSEKANIILNLYKESVLNDPEVFLMTSTEAEAVKLFSNTYLAMRVAFFNELDNFAAVNNLNTKSLVDGICSDKRIGNFYNNPSFGYGGYCLPKDTKQLLSSYKSIPNNLISAIVSSNDTRKKFIADEIIGKNPKIVGVYRLTMKKGSDNFRKSAVFDIISILKRKNVKVVVFEPTIKEDEFEDLKIIHNLSEFKNISDIIIANRKDKDLKDVEDKIYTKDIFERD